MKERKMPIFLTLLISCVVAMSSSNLLAQDPTSKSNSDQEQEAAKKVGTETKKNSSDYDAELAKQVGADDYGMKSYVFVTLITGKKKIADPDLSKKIFAGHFANMKKLAAEGKLVLAGPFVESAPKRGLFILDVTTIEAAKKLVETDPAVKAGVFDYELNKLYCSAALMKISEIHKTIQKTPIE